MDLESLRTLLDSVAQGETPAEAAAERLAHLPFNDIGEAKIDHHRSLRCGFSEVVFCEGKTPSQVRAIARDMLDHGDVFLGTRASASHFQRVAQVAADARYFEGPRLLVVDRRAERPAVGHIVVASAGTADSDVAEEAAISAEVMGNRVTRVYDVGVAGVHRLFAHADLLREANVIIAVAGMEGALPSLITGLVACPVVAVPTSVGYGASMNGLAALLGMLTGCASGMGVVNIDNGFGAAALASRINRMIAEAGASQAPDNDADASCPGAER